MLSESGHSVPLSQVKQSSQSVNKRTCLSSVSYLANPIVPSQRAIRFTVSIGSSNVQTVGFTLQTIVLDSDLIDPAKYRKFSLNRTFLSGSFLRLHRENGEIRQRRRLKWAVGWSKPEKLPILTALSDFRQSLSSRPVQPSCPSPTTFVQIRPLLSENSALPGFSSSCPNILSSINRTACPITRASVPSFNRVHGSALVATNQAPIQVLPSTHGKSFELWSALSSIIQSIQYVLTVRPVSPQIILTSIFGTRSLQRAPAVHSISFHTCWTLHTALKKALHDDEYEELKESKLGVFIKFQELGFDWASRLVHYMLGFPLDIKKKYELWSLVGPEPVRFSLLEFENLTGLNCEYIEDLERPHCVVTKELTSFWEMLGVHVEAGPSTQEIIAAFERCEGWSWDDRKRLAYLAIFTGYIEGRKYSTPTRVSLARLVMELERFENYPRGRVAFKVLMDSVKGRDISGCYTINGFTQALQIWVYTALPELGANYGNPLPNNPSPPILAYKGRKGRIQFKEAILSQVFTAI
ncbi:hypothetical protein YC2023_059845 [Brassica napus]